MLSLIFNNIQNKSLLESGSAIPKIISQKEINSNTIHYELTMKWYIHFQVCIINEC